MHLTQLLVPTLTHQLTALASWIDKAQVFATGRGQEPDELLALRLAPDMFPLATQLRFAAFQAQEPVFRLRGKEVTAEVLAVRQEGRDAGERPGTMAAARARLNEALALLAAVGPDEFDAMADRPITHDLPTGMVFDMTGATYVRDWALPQVAFHQMAAYALLRHAGVPLGKADYVPHMFAYLRPGTGPGA